MTTTRSGFDASLMGRDAVWTLREVRPAMIDAGADEDDIRIVALNPTNDWPQSFLGDLREHGGEAVANTTKDNFDNDAMNVRIERDGEIVFSVQRW